MTADFSTTTMAPQPAPFHHHHAYTKSAHHTPLGSGATTPAEHSPISPRNTSHLNYVPQIRPLKAPIYTPAALRKTETLRQSPPKTDSVMESPNGSWGSGTGLAQPTREGVSISRVGTEDLNSIYGEAPLSPVTGPITKNHWQPDSASSVCSASACQAPFGFFNRRHHCRKCGGIFCWQHSQKRVKLNELALFHAEGDWQRACDRCHTQYREWEQLRTSRQNSDSSSSAAAVEIDTSRVAKRPENTRIGSLATSVQNAWNWSTF